MLLDWFGEHRGHWTRRKLELRWSVNWNLARIQVTSKSRTQWVYIFSPGSLCCLPQNFTSKNIIGEFWTVAGEYLWINRSIAGEMQNPARYTTVNTARGTHAIWSLASTLLKGQLTISQKGSQYSHICMHSIIDVSRYWLDNTLKWVSMECQQCWVL